MQFCVLSKLFTAGSPTGTIVSVRSLGEQELMLENLKLERTPRTSLTRRSCAIFECVITSIFFSMILTYAFERCERCTLRIQNNRKGFRFEKIQL